MNAPPVSVVMPVRNAAGTVGDAIESIRGQDFADFEFVVVDHASEDGTAEILREAADRDDRIRTLTHRGTFVEAANLAWRSSTGELVARMDGDDVAHPERLRRQVEFLEAHPGIAACGTLVSIVRRGENGATLPADDGYRRYENWVNSVVEPSEIERERFVDSPLPNPTSMIRRCVLEDLAGYGDPAWAEDYDFWLRLLERGHRLGKVPERLLDWHDAPSRSTRNLERYSLARFQEAKAHFLARIPRVAETGVVLCGAGPIGKEMARLLSDRGIPVHAFVEVNERQIGNRIAGVPVRGAGALSSFAGSAVAIGAVGQPGARDRIRGLVTESGFREGDDFFCVA